MKKVKYLIAFKGVDAFCSTSESFLHLLRAYSNLSVENNNIQVSIANNNYSASYQIKIGDIKNIHNSKKNEKYRYIIITIISDEIENLRVISRTIKKTAKKITEKDVYINTLWDDVGRSYSIELFPLINEVENLMRCLITQFMVINIGVDWSLKEIDEKITNKVKNSKESPLHEDDLYKVDFRHLSEILFKEISRTDYNTLIRLLKKTSFNIEDQKIIEGYIPSTNWDKYFRKIFKTDKEKIEDNWSDLSDYRNHIAHNYNIPISTYEKIKGIAQETISILDSAINNLTTFKYEEPQESSSLSSIQSQEIDDIKVRCWIVNTNIRWDASAYKDMLDNNKASAYYDKKWGITNIEEGNVVYLYHSKVGIVAKGTALSTYKSIDKNLDPDEEYYVPLDITWKVNPITDIASAIPAWKINQILGTSHRFRNTVFSISSEMCNVISRLISEKNKKI